MTVGTVVTVVRVVTIVSLVTEVTIVRVATVVKEVTVVTKKNHQKTCFTKNLVFPKTFLFQKMLTTNICSQKNSQKNLFH